MRCWKWVPSTNLERLQARKKTILLERDWDHLVKYDTESGSPIDDWPAEGREYKLAQSGQCFDFLDSMNRFHVVSARLKAFLEENVRDPMQFLPIRVIDKMGKPKEIGEYYILNALLMFPASVDFENSKYHLDNDGEIRGCFKTSPG